MEFRKCFSAHKVETLVSSPIKVYYYITLAEKVLLNIRGIFKNAGELITVQHNTLTYQFAIF